MATPTPEHIEGFFQGMRHAMEIANRNRRGRSSRMARAIWKELATLELYNERRKNKGAPSCSTR